MKSGNPPPLRRATQQLLPQMAVAIPMLLTSPVVAGLLVAWPVWHLIRLTDPGSLSRWLLTGALIPLAYVAWLLTFLVLFALDVRNRPWFVGAIKRPRTQTGDGFLRYYPPIEQYLRMRLVFSMPFVPALAHLPGVRWLVYWSYSLSAHLGPESQVWGTLFDPDLTTIGAGAVIGSHSVVVAHSVTTLPNGEHVMVTAPVVIGDRALVGGGSRIGHGVTIGNDAIVEPMSSVEAFTTIGPGEVWGGNPAVFRRHRFRDELATTASSGADPLKVAALSDADAVLIAREAVALGLLISLDEVHPTSCMDDFSDRWDSLGQMAIAAAVYSLTQREYPAADRFTLKTVRQLADWLKASTRSPVDSAARPLLNVADEPLPADPELLPLLDRQRVTRQLASGAVSSTLPGGLPAVLVTVSATFVTDPMNAALRLWSRAFRIPVEITSTGFSQIVQALLDPASPVVANRSGLNVVMVRVEDLLSSNDPAASMELLLDAIRTFATAHPRQLVVSDLPPALRVLSASEQARSDRLRARWEDALAGISSIDRLTLTDAVFALGTTAARACADDEQRGLPWSSALYEDVAVRIARLVRRCRLPARKVLALDADGVLWGGVLAEDGVDGIVIGGAGEGDSFAAFQRTALELKKRGVLLVVVSRNQESDVRAVFASHPGMVLKTSDIAGWRVNWAPKSVNLVELAAELNVGIDSFVFVDDDPVNQVEVATAQPSVVVIPLEPEPASRAEQLRRLWCFDGAGMTDADRDRTAQILAERERDDLRSAATDLDAWLHQLRLAVLVSRATADDLPRVAQLTQKTNQFNLSLLRRSEAELAELMRNHDVLTIRAADRFGDYGMIGVAIVGGSGSSRDEFVLDTLLLSCRALGRGIEDGLLAELASRARSRGLTTLVAPHVVGHRNQPIRVFLERVGFVDRASGHFVISVDAVPDVPTHLDWNSEPLV